jgi:hypothetical protein
MYDDKRSFKLQALLTAVVLSIISLLAGQRVVQVLHGISHLYLRQKRG